MYRNKDFQCGTDNRSRSFQTTVLLIATAHMSVSDWITAISPANDATHDVSGIFLFA
jgi:hypothetical protein